MLSLFMCTQYILCFRVLNIICVLNIYNAFVIYVYSIYITLSLFMCTQYILCFRYLCVLNIYYAFVINVYSIYIMLPLSIMCTSYILCFRYLSCVLQYKLCFRYLSCVLNINYASVIYHVYSIYIMLSSLCVLNIYYAFIINVYSIYIMLPLSIMCTSYKLMCFRYLSCVLHIN